MKNVSSSLVHRFNNQFTTLVTAVEAMEANLDNAEYLKEIFAEIMNKREDFNATLLEIRSILEEREKYEN